MSFYSTAAAKAMSGAPGRPSLSTSETSTPMSNEKHGEDGSDPHGQKPTRRFFRRPRAGRACGTCHSRRVRCDAGSHGIPCTNCAAFSLECSIPLKKRSKREGNTMGRLKHSKQRGRSTQVNYDDEKSLYGSTATSPDDFASLLLQADQHMKQQPDDTETYAQLVKFEAARSEIEDPGQVAYLDEFSNMSFLIQEYHGPAGVHYPIPKMARDTTVSTKLSEIEHDILQKRGALSLPPKELCDELVEAYFKWVAPIVPIINRTSFMRRYRDFSNPPSILLMQAILLAGSRVCTTSLLLDSNGSSIPAATIFYQRAKALYDAGYEVDRVTIVQALILMGWYWEDPGKVTKNVFYWNGLATTIAQGCGMHRSTRQSRLSLADQRLWTRIWWTLFTRDRSVAVACGRPAHINLDASDVEMVCEEDFIEENGAQPKSAHIRFFLQYVKLCEIMDLILVQNYSISSKTQHHNAMALTQCDLALAEWLQNCPAELTWDQSRYYFWSAYLHCIYNTASCLLHRAHLPSAPAPAACISLTRSPAFQAAHSITSIVQSLIAHNDLRHAPPFIIYSISSAVIVYIYHLHTAMPAEANAQRKRILTCMDALERVSEMWLVGKMVHNLFQSVLTIDGFETVVDRESMHDSHHEYYRERHVEEIGIDEGSTPESNDSRRSLKTLPLTAALLAHMGAALQSASSSSTSENSDISSSSKSSTAPIRQVQPAHSERHPTQNMRPLAPHNGSLGEHNTMWMDYDVLSIPGSVGLHAGERSVHFATSRLLQYHGVQ